MAPPPGEWQPLRRDDGREALIGAGFSVTSRTQESPDELWISVGLPDSGWSYVVLRDGRVAAQATAGSKREAYRQVIEDRARARVH
jgi:hypothetical protein